MTALRLSPGSDMAALRAPRATFLSHAVGLRRLADRMLALASRRARLSDRPEDQDAARRLRDIAAAMSVAAERSEAVWRQGLDPERRAAELGAEWTASSQEPAVPGQA